MGVQPVVKFKGKGAVYGIPQELYYNYNQELVTCFNELNVKKF